MSVDTDEPTSRGWATLGTRWVPEVLLALQLGPLRYSELATQLTLVADGQRVYDRTLQTALTRVVEAGLVEHEPGRHGARRYALTADGSELAGWVSAAPMWLAPGRAALWRVGELRRS